MTILFSNPVIDLIYERNGSRFSKRPGGPSYYSSLYANLLDDELIIVGSTTPTDKPFFEEILTNKNTTTLIQVSNCTQKYLLLYLRQEKRLAIPLNECPLPHNPFLLLYKNSIDHYKQKNILWNPTIIASLKDLQILQLAKNHEINLHIDFQSIIRKTDYLYHSLRLINRVKTIHLEKNELVKLSKILNSNLNGIIRVLKAKEIIVSNGGKELIYYNKKKYRVKPPFNANVIDTTGAGDILIYSYTAYSDKMHYMDAIKKAVATASLHVLWLNNKIKRLDKSIIEEYSKKVVVS